MRIALINGSPKVKDSSSGILLEDLQNFLHGRCEVTKIAMHSPDVSEETIKELCSADAWVFAYPLYVDCVPAHLLSCLVQLEDRRLYEREISIYGIVNCGFYEGIQAEPALNVLQNWCTKAGLCWGGGLGVGGGGGIAMMSGPRPDKGPKAPINKELEMIADEILRCRTRENHFVSVAFPRFLYRLAAQMGWRQLIRTNGGKAKDLGWPGGQQDAGVERCGKVSAR